MSLSEWVEGNGPANHLIPQPLLLKEQGSDSRLGYVLVLAPLNQRLMLVAVQGDALSLPGLQHDKQTVLRLRSRSPTGQPAQMTTHPLNLRGRPTKQFKL